MGSAVMERASELQALVESLARLRDGIGVLSVTIGIEPGAVSGGTPAWEIALENDLRRLRHDGAVGQALGRRLAADAPRLARLLDPTSSGRGRALYVPLELGSSSEVTLQRALPTSARVGPVAHVLPLLAALDQGEPAGLVMASRDAISVLQSELGRTREVDRIELEPWVGDWWPEMKGPAASNPLRGQHTVAQRDRYARRVAAAYRHTLAESPAAIGALAHDRRWTRAVLAGDPRTIEVLDEALRDGGVATATIGANLEGLRREDVVRRLDAALETLVAEQVAVHARLAVEEAAAGGRGAYGLVPVLAALAEGRVARLVIDPSRPFPGTVGAGESLSAADEAGERVDLTDWVVSRALTTDAAVTPVFGDAAQALEGRGGIAALLRW